MDGLQSRATWPGRPCRQLWIPGPCISAGLRPQVPAPAWPQARPGSPACRQRPSPARPGPSGRPQRPAPRAPLLARRPEPPRPCARPARSPQRPAGLPAQPCPESSYSGLALSSCRIRVSRQGARGQRAQQGRAGLPACSQRPTFLRPSLPPGTRPALSPGRPDGEPAPGPGLVHAHHCPQRPACLTRPCAGSAGTASLPPVPWEPWVCGPHAQPRDGHPPNLLFFWGVGPHLVELRASSWLRETDLVPAVKPRVAWLGAPSPNPASLLQKIVAGS